MNILIAKLGASGDVVRTTPLLRKLRASVTWLTDEKNTVLLRCLNRDLRCLCWRERDLLRDRAYDLVINLEDSFEVGHFLTTIQFKQLFGAYAGPENTLRYTDDSRGWFELSLISAHGKETADSLKLRNRHSYQELIFQGLGLRFEGERYVLPSPVKTDLEGDVAISPEAGPVWPMKNWACYNQLKQRLEQRGLKVNVLPKRSSLLEHLGDVCNHRCLVSGDSLPMHLALGVGTWCVTLFSCTSPWEIHDYGIQHKIVSPLLDQYFYKRGYDARATTAITVDEVLDAVLRQLEASAWSLRLHLESAPVA
jgi:heptosyltransferase II